MTLEEAITILKAKIESVISKLPKDAEETSKLRTKKSFKVQTLEDKINDVYLGELGAYNDCLSLFEQVDGKEDK